MTTSFALDDRGGSRNRRRRTAPNPPRQRRVVRWSLIAAALLLTGLVVLGLGGLWPRLGSRGSLEAELSNAPPEVAEFYQTRGYSSLWLRSPVFRPFWAGAPLRPEARQMAALAKEALPGEIAEPTRRQVASAIAAAEAGRPGSAAQAEVALTVALSEYLASLQRSPADVQLAFVDPEFAPPAGPREALDQVADAPSLSERLTQLRDVNPVYHALRGGLAVYRRDWSRLPQIQVPAGPELGLGDSGERVRLLRVRLGLPAGNSFDPALAQAVRRFQAAHSLEAGGQADAPTIAALNAGAAHYERLIEANLQRARVLPPLVGKRFILVNAAAAQMWVYENGKAKDSMRVVVGKRDEQTPMMAGLMRYVVFNPYWEVPIDLVRSSIAPKVLQSGPGYLQASHLQALSDWGDSASELQPKAINWRAVAHGDVELRVRQKPGGDNMMGGVKFMLPNELGIYLHDTPNKQAFQSGERLLSAGCVRLERAHDLVGWLLGGRMPSSESLGVDQRIDLDAPVTVYITYLTAAPGRNGVTFYPDVYGRDPALLARVARPRSPALPAQGNGPAHARRAAA